MNLTKEQTLALKKVAETDAGVEVLAVLKDACGLHLASVAIDKTGRVDERATYMNEGRRELWLELRQHLPPARRTLIENPEKKEVQNVSKPASNDGTGSSGHATGYKPTAHNTSERSTKRGAIIKPPGSDAGTTSDAQRIPPVL